MSGTEWTKREDEVLKQHFADIAWQELLDMLPARTYDAINYHARRVLGLKRNGKVGARGGRIWTAEEDAILKEHYGSADWNTLLELLPGKTRAAIYNHASKLRLKRQVIANAWTNEEDAILREYYATTDMGALLELLPGRTKGGISARAFMLGLRKDRTVATEDIKDKTPKRKNAWTNEEDAILREYYPVMRMVELTKLLPTRTFYAIETRVSKLGLSKDGALKHLTIKQWERDLLIEWGPNADMLSLKMLLPNRSTAEICHMLELIGID